MFVISGSKVDKTGKGMSIFSRSPEKVLILNRCLIVSEYGNNQLLQMRTILRLY